MQIVVDYEYENENDGESSHSASLSCRANPGTWLRNFAHVCLTLEDLTDESYRR